MGGVAKVKFSSLFDDENHALQWTPVPRFVLNSSMIFSFSRKIYHLVEELLVAVGLNIADFFSFSF